MKSYDNPQYRSYYLGLVDFGAGGAANSIPVPAWATGARLLGASVNGLTEAFTADTTGAHLLIGTAGDPDKFFDGVFGVVSLTDSADVNGATNAGKEIHCGYDGDAGAALTQLEVTMAAPTGGTPGGIGLLEVSVAWY